MIRQILIKSRKRQRETPVGLPGTWLAVHQSWHAICLCLSLTLIEGSSPGRGVWVLPGWGASSELVSVSVPSRLVMASTHVTLRRSRLDPTNLTNFQPCVRGHREEASRRRIVLSRRNFKGWLCCTLLYKKKLSNTGMGLHDTLW